MVLDRLDNYMQKQNKTNLDSYLVHTNIYSKLAIDLDIKPKNINLLKQSIGENFYDFGLATEWHQKYEP